MHDDFDPRLLLPLHQVDFEELQEVVTEEPFVREGFELLKEASILLAVVAGIRTERLRNGLSRDQAIIVGHYARMTKLMKSLIRQLSDGHGGDQQIAVSREFMDSVSTVMYLLRDPGDGARYTSYVMDSLIAEREFLKDVREQVAQRGGVMLPIEERINRSIADTLSAAGVREKDIPSRRNNGWPNAQARIELLGPTAYSAYRTGSGAVHGSFTEIYKNYLDGTSGGFEIELRPQRFRPQPLLSMALLSLMTLSDYSFKFLGVALPQVLEDRGRSLLDVLRRVDDLHERYLADRQVARS
ncbi:hypothetical protein E3T40_04115 [Cryobacterium sp. TMT1-19]|uniref:DUF5677 domain-containing protein n=1 Tax=Cryobacterium sp. TMT1-19 TaxID=1259231 RepID=UPI0010697C2C|nr:DUF5677 domain-containing protein [Cryobacterium sp. TMT1-19]TFD37780.1 hypothetical protein E3T40_04115 [Cryobacterium sp. TMT1-19]